MDREELQLLISYLTLAYTVDIFNVSRLQLDVALKHLQVSERILQLQAQALEKKPDKTE